MRYTDPTGHDICDEDGNCHDGQGGWHLLAGASKWNYSRLIRTGYSDWEAQALSTLYKKGGRAARHSVDYIVTQDIHLTVGESFMIFAPNPNGDTYSGDWQSMGDVAGWYNRNGNSIVLNPNKGYDSGEMPDTWGLATIIHEAKHLEQGAPLTKYKELEAMQISIDVAINLGGYYGQPGQEPARDSRDGGVLALTVSHDPRVINLYSEILRQESFGYWIFYNFLPIDSPRPSP